MLAGERASSQNGLTPSGRSDHLNVTDDSNDAGSAYGTGKKAGHGAAKNLTAERKALLSTSKETKKKTDKLIHINTAMQKKFNSLKRTSKSRFDGVQKYLNGAFVKK